MEGPLVVLIVFFSLTGIIGAWLITRHRERTQIIEKGLSADEIRALALAGGFRTDPLSSLKWGMVFVGIGLASTLGVWLNVTFRMGEEFIPGLIALFGGAGLILFYVVARKASAKAHQAQ